MLESVPGSKRRRWVWTLLFVSLGTISMVGPTQAVSNLVTATVTVMTTLARVLGPTAEPESTALESRTASTAARQWSSGPQITIERAVELMNGTDELSLEGRAVSESAGTGAGATKRNEQAGNARSSGGGSSAPGAGGGGFGGGGGAGSDPASSEMAGAASDPVATASHAIVDGATDDPTNASELIAAVLGGGAVDESVIASATGGDAVTTESIVQSLLGIDQGLAASEGLGKESLVGDAGNSAPTGAAGDDVVSPAGTAGGSPFAGADVASATGLVQSLMSEPLAEFAQSLMNEPLADQKVNYHSAQSLADAGNSAGGSANARVGVAQLPEPSSLILLSLGVAAVVQHARRRR